MQEIKEILVISVVVLLAIVGLRLVIKAARRWGKTLKTEEDAERKPTNCVGVIHPAQVFIDDKPLEGIQDLKLELDRLREIDKRRPYKPMAKEATIRASTNDEVSKLENMDSLTAFWLYTSINDTPMSDNTDSTYEGNGHGGDFGGGGASGSWDSTSDNSSSYDSGSSDSGSSD